MSDSKSFLKDGLRKLPTSFRKPVPTASVITRKPAPALPTAQSTQTPPVAVLSQPPPPAYHQVASYQPRNVELLPRDHPLARRMMCCGNCQRIIYPGEEFRVCLACPPLYSLCSRMKCATLDHGTHPMTTSRIVLRTDTIISPQETCSFCHQVKMSTSWIDCGYCDAQRVCLDCHGRIKDVVHKPYCQRPIADINYVLRNDLMAVARVENSSISGNDCQECGIKIALNEPTYACFSCDEMKAEYGICFHCFSKYRQGQPLRNHDRSHKFDSIDTCCVIDPSTRHNKRLNETWNCDNCKTEYDMGEARRQCNKCETITCGRGDCEWISCPRCPLDIVRQFGVDFFITERYAALHRTAVTSCENCDERIAISEAFYRCKLCVQNGGVSGTHLSIAPKGIFCYRCYSGTGPVPNEHFRTHPKGNRYWCITLDARDWEVEKNEWRFDCNGNCGNVYGDCIPRINTHDLKTSKTYPTCLSCFWSSGIGSRVPQQDQSDNADHVTFLVYVGVPADILARPPIVESAADKNERLTRELAEMKLQKSKSSFSKSLLSRATSSTSSFQKSLSSNSSKGITAAGVAGAAFKGISSLASSKSGAKENKSKQNAHKPHEAKHEARDKHKHPHHPPHHHKKKKKHGPGEEEEEGGGDAGGDVTGGGDDGIGWSDAFGAIFGALGAGVAAGAAMSSNNENGTGNQGYGGSSGTESWGVYGDAGGGGGGSGGEVPDSSGIYSGGGDVYDSSGMSGGGGFSMFDFSGSGGFGFGGFDYSGFGGSSFFGGGGGGGFGFSDMFAGY